MLVIRHSSFVIRHSSFVTFMTLRKIAAGLLVSAICLYFVLRNVEWNEVWSHLADVSIPLFLLSMLLMLAAYFLMTWRWQHLLDPLDIPGPTTTPTAQDIRSKIQSLPLNEVKGPKSKIGIRHHASILRLYAM